MTQTLFKPEEIEQLQAPFEAHEYEVREGPKTADGSKIRWFVYIRREAIQRRLTDVFGLEWGTKKESETIHGNNVTVCRSITIRGIHRDFTGSASPNGADDEHLVKSADTDAFKRVASMWGIGLELQSAPMIYTPLDYKGKGTDWNLRAKREQEALNQFIKWLTGEVRPAPTGNGKTAQTGAQGAEWANKESIAAMVANFQEKTNTNATASDLAQMAGIDKPSNYTAWNTTYATDGDAKKAIWAAYQDNALNDIQATEITPMAAIEAAAQAAESAAPK